ncbi:fibronectin type 3 and ankyrin repeat domains protein 1 isoform X2 [Rhinatrema bivittatum]|uniref:fibronectin type 3 and ankyrin repeat domains protein 1 isoform X2 n=1 Tax=Rhinatrema bivittatum TaxID=194408 RepID=UPI00112C4963|nr:fibronectin type 3 and ankyrin repeat domains protein 1 isoform X2 [Rhinatrema bivittatum]
MDALGQADIPKPDPPVVGTVTHHSIELYWDLDKNLQRTSSHDQWLNFSIEEEDSKTHTYGTIYTGYAKRYTVEGLQPSASYRFRLKVTSSNGDYNYSPVVTVSTTREPKSGEDLHRAVNMNDEDAVIKILRTRSVKTDVPDKLGFTALMVAAQKGYSGLMLACFAGHLDIVKHLREHGASWETRDKSGCAAIHSAADGGHLSVIQWMISDGSKVDIKDSHLEWTPLMRVSSITGNTDVAACFIEAGADVNVKDKDGKTPLMVAALNNHEGLVQLLLENGADHSVKNEYGKTIVEMAHAFGRQNVVSLLLKMRK